MPNTHTPISKQSKKKDKHKFIQNFYFQHYKKVKLKKYFFLVGLYPSWHCIGLPIPNPGLPDSGIMQCTDGLISLFLLSDNELRH
jgi:hypothetical protein